MNISSMPEALDALKSKLLEAESLVETVRVSGRKYKLITLDELPAKLRALRKEQKITQGTLSELAGVSVGLISKIEDGDLNISLQKLKGILDVFGVEVCFK